MGYDVSLENVKGLVYLCHYRNLFPRTVRLKDIHSGGMHIDSGSGNGQSLENRPYSPSRPVSPFRVSPRSPLSTSTSSRPSEGPGLKHFSSENAEAEGEAV